MIDVDTVQPTDGGTRFHRAIAILLGTIAVLAAGLGAVQLHRSQAESRATVEAARLSGDLAAGIPVSNMTLSMRGALVQAAITRQMEGATRQFVSLQANDSAGVAEGVAEQAAGERLADVAIAMGATPDTTTGLPPYELRLMTTGDAALQSEVAEQNRAVDVDAATASADSGLSVAGLSVLALAGVLVGLASILGADRAGRATLAMAWLTTTVAAILLITTLW